MRERDGEFCARLRTRIRGSDLWGQRSRESGGKFSGLKCPECGRWEAWAYADFPWWVICNHKSTCGARVKTIDLFPELVTNIEKEFPPTAADPDAPARQYLFARGLSAKTLEGLRFVYRKNIRKCGSGGVLFYVGVDGAGHDVWNGRIFSPPPGEDKSHNQGATAGLCWWHPGIVYDPARPLFVVEGIIDALSLIEMGLQAIAILSSGQDPGKLRSKLGEYAGNLVIALDPDAAGASGLEKWKAIYPAARAICAVKGDWNDFLKAHGGRAAEAFKEALPEMECRAKLLLAETAQEYADIWFAFYGRPPFLFEFGRKYWWGVFGKKELETRNVSNFVLETDHFQLDTSSPDNPVYRYFLKVSPAAGQPKLCSMAGTDLASPNAIRSAFLENACAVWKGDQGPSLALTSKIVDSGAPVVRQVHVLGHDRESGCLVFSDFAVDRDGKVHSPDGKGFFRLGRREILRPPPIESDRDRTIRPKKGESMKRIYELLNAAWPDNGPLALAFWVASWFAYAVKPELGFFPFLSLWGDTQTGKSGLARRLNAMQCWDSEGLPMTKLNTGKGEIRDLAKKSSMCIPLLEGNKEEKMRFDLNSLLTLFNAGNPLQVRAKKSNDLATRVTEFQATLCFVQNKEPFQTKAQMERVVSSRMFVSKDLTDSSIVAFRELLRIPGRELGQAYLEVMSRRREVEAGWYAEYIRARDEIMQAVPDNRIAEVHGLVLAFHRYAEKFFGAKNDLTIFLVSLATRKQRKCNHREATEADMFFESLDTVDPKTAEKYAHVVDGKFFVNLPEALRSLEGNGFKFYKQPLMEALRDHPAYLVSNWSHRATWDYVGLVAVTENKKCWVFDVAKLSTEMCVMLGP